MMPELEQLKERVHELKMYQYSLECSDDYLFSNRSGNLATYESWTKELNKIYKQIKEIESGDERKQTTESRV